MEFNAQFSDSVDNFFPTSLIRACSQDYDLTSFRDPRLAYSLGVGWGRVNDSSVMAVVSKTSDGIRRVENLVELANTPFDKQIGTLFSLNDAYSFSSIVVEKAGLSLPLCERLRATKLPTVEFVPTLDSKVEAYNHLKKLMEEQRLIIPSKNQKLQRQLRGFRYEITESGKMKLHHATETIGDDFCDALMMACWGRPRPAFRVGGAGRWY